MTSQWLAAARLPLMAICGLAVAFGGLSSAVAQEAPQCNVKSYGAKGDGTALDTVSIQKAVEACHAQGGGTVSFPPGRYLTGTVRFEDNVTLSLGAGATLLGSKNLADYQSGVPGQQWYYALILAKGVHNVALVGAGVIDGQEVFNPNGEEQMRGPHAALFMDTQDVTIRDVTFQNAGNYNLILRSSMRANIDGITVKGGFDGINMHDVRDVTIANCRLFTGDDALAGEYWDNVTVTNCILNSSCNAIRVGGTNVLISNSVIYGPGQYEHRLSLRHNTESGFQILPQTARRGHAKTVVPDGPVDNMVLSNIIMHNVRSPIWIAYDADAPYSEHNFGVGRIIVDNLTVTGGGKTPLYVSAPPDNPAKSIVLNNVRATYAGGGDETQTEGQNFSPYSILQAYGGYFRNVAHLELHDSRFDSLEKDLRPAMIGEGIGTLELDRFVADHAAGASPEFLFSGIQRMLVDGKEAGAADVQVKGLQIDSPQVTLGRPFEATVLVRNAGSEGLGNVVLRLGDQTLERKVWLRAGESAPVHFVNVQLQKSGQQQAQAGEYTQMFNVLPRPAATEASAPYREFHNVEATLEQSGDGFYIRAQTDASQLVQFDRYGAMYLPKGLPSNGTVVVRLENPDLRSSWPGRVGIMVRNDIAKPGESNGYLILAASPSNGYCMEWDSNGAGRLNKHTEFDGYTYWPGWLKLERHGSHFTGYSSRDNVNWTKVGEVEISGADERLDVGLFAHGSSARFDHFTISAQP
jgi:hypothetical protein